MLSERSAYTRLIFNITVNQLISLYMCLAETHRNIVETGGDKKLR